MMKNKIAFGTIVVLLSLFLVNLVNAQVSEYPQITNQWCDAMNSCPEGLECFSFPSIGLRCAQSNPCSYFGCPERTQCSVAESYPGQVMCFCVGPECPATSGDEDTVSYDLLTQTVVHTIDSDEQTVSHNISLWKTTDEDRGILETPITSVEYRGKIVVRKSKLFMNMPTNKEEPINFLPKDAIRKSKDISETPEIIKVELKAEAEKPIYSVKGVKQARLLFLIPVNLEIETKISAESSEVISVNKPWWSFLAW